jgi:hypothetical protein
MNIPNVYVANSIKSEVVEKKYTKDGNDVYDEVLKKEYESKKKKKAIKIDKVAPKDPDDFFLLDFYPDDHVYRFGFSSDEVLEKIEKIIFTESTIHLKDIYYELKNSHRLSLGVRNINSTFLFISTRQSWLGVAGTLINRLQTYYDRTQISKNVKNIDYMYEKINAFATEYDFFSDIKALDDKNYQALAPIIKDIFHQSSNCINNEIYFKNINAIKNLYNIMTRIGYDQEELSKKIVFHAGSIDKLEQNMTIEKLAFLARMKN